jgi:Fe-S-cluster containining protein
VRFHYPKNLAFTCNDCGICCGDTNQKTRHILLTQKDAQQVVIHAKQPIAVFAVEIHNQAPYIYEIKKQPETGKCVFHQNSQCTIYVARPLICRFYPFQLSTDETGTFVFTETDECPQIKPCTSKSKKLSRKLFEQLLQQAHESLS